MRVGQLQGKKREKKAFWINNVTRKQNNEFAERSSVTKALVEGLF